MYKDVLNFVRGNPIKPLRVLKLVVIVFNKEFVLAEIAYHFLSVLIVLINPPICVRGS